MATDGTPRSLQADAPHPEVAGMSEWGDESGDTNWLRRSTYPKRSDAIRWAVDEWCVTWPEVRARLRWVRPATVQEYDTTDGWCSVYVCDRNHPTAFQVWEVT